MNPSEKDNPDSKIPLFDSPIAKRWVEISELIQRARYAQNSVSLNETLNQYSNELRNTPLNQVITLWMADNYLCENKFEEAIQMYNQVPQIPVINGPFSQVIDANKCSLRRVAYSYLCLRRFDNAIEAYLKLFDYTRKTGKSDYTILRKVANIALTIGETSDAEQYLNKIISENSNNAAIADNAFRDLKRIREANFTKQNTKEFASVLITALKGNNIKLVSAMASKSHFSIGLGCHSKFCDREEILSFLIDDLKSSAKTIELTEIEQSGSKCYLHTIGWKGKYFKNAVSFLLVETFRGWEWKTIVITTPLKFWLNRWMPEVKETNHPLTMEIKAPWPEGMKFKAGGLAGFIAAETAILALGALGPLGYLRARALALLISAGKCGYGLRGLYYNQGTTHNGTDAFAIDFTRYKRGKPYKNKSGGVPVLAVQDGIVSETDFESCIVSGDDADPNRVRINHGFWSTVILPSGPVEFYFASHYYSRYLHMAGPGMIPVSEGFHVIQGARLGLMNDTGTSVLNHLHFSMHDTGLSGKSVRPTPMDGYNLKDGDDGKCITSSNIPFPPDT